ncbi:predicted protein [Chaetomium globosum CBS 148.51]|uniref:Uncharacterized protein n=1 Tax=Chaetomium globosum (strain ATCC 6205 / CBS 148.51 / DSM 1962 / NBRC 6347 / NRRL 1970) TaxID=306901 RepID=Q2HEX3_CHAGB|nr:uncharacterized protein CHGG_01231 [Chaetomium globosum CBS 148.51]EAQ92996.1 predicted protein [Chaetomium globosum CBS 148.51]
MGVPVALATVAACGSIVTSIKSSWELRRMVKRKQEAKECEEEAPYIFRRLRRAYIEGLMSTIEYEQWYEKFLVAKVEKDLSGMRRIRAHMRILENGAPLTSSHRSRGVEPPRRRQSVTYGAPQPRASSSDVSSKGRSRSTSGRHEPRGRSEKKYDSYDSSDSGENYSEKRHYRGRRYF